MRTATILAVAIVLTLAGCGSDDGADSSQTDPAPTTPDEPEAGDNNFGTVDAPLPAGTPLTLTAWDVTIGPTTITTEAPSTDLSPAEPGMVRFIADVTAMRIAQTVDSLGSFEAGVVFSVMGASGVEINDVCSTGDDIDDVADVAPEATISGQICAYLPEDETAGAVWQVYEQGGAFVGYVAQS